MLVTVVVGGLVTLAGLAVIVAFAGGGGSKQAWNAIATQRERRWQYQQQLLHWEHQRHQSTRAGEGPRCRTRLPEESESLERRGEQLA